MKRGLVLLALVAAWRPTAAPAQLPPPPKPATITLRPAAEPVPALKYRLVPERRSLVAGNAAVFYHRAIEFVIETFRRQTLQRKGAAQAPASPEIRISEWLEGPASATPREEARTQLDLYRNALKEVELGAARSTCDWEFDLRNEGMHLLIPEIQEMRSLARLVALRARLAILDDKPDEAMHWLEVGMVMGRHVSQGPTLIQALVGVAIDSIMLRGIEDLVQLPGMPSLYWALADRPRPFIDLRYPLEGERYTLESEFPQLEQLDEGPWSIDQARRFADDLQRKLLGMGVHQPPPGNVLSELPDMFRRLGVAAMVSKIYPAARRSLIARGRTEAGVESMPVVQVAALSTYREYQRMRDDSYKWLNLPYWQAYGGLDRSLYPPVDQRLANPLLTFFRNLSPALGAGRMASVRLERRLDLLQCIEAIRLHAAAHEGKLPATLKAITAVPIPVDPITGSPFSYELQGDSASLSAPTPAGGPVDPAPATRYLLKLAR